MFAVFFFITAKERNSCIPTRCINLWGKISIYSKHGKVFMNYYWFGISNGAKFETTLLKKPISLFFVIMWWI
jgi:hypothetical protein